MARSWHNQRALGVRHGLSRWASGLRRVRPAGAAKSSGVGLGTVRVVRWTVPPVVGGVSRARAQGAERGGAVEQPLPCGGGLGRSAPVVGAGSTLGFTRGQLWGVAFLVADMAYVVACLLGEYRP